MSMWGRKEPEEARPAAPASPAKEPTAARQAETTSAAPPPAAAPARGTGMDQQQQRRAIIGPSIHVKGELIGNEDLIIEGKVEGVVRLLENQLTIGKSSECQATLEAKTIRVEGTVRGDVKAGDRVELAAGSTLIGDIVAPRIAISDGARFKGSVDMDHGGRGHAAPAPQPQPAQQQQPAAVTTKPIETERKPSGVSS